MGRKYVNQADVDKVKKMLETISPDLRILWCSTDRELKVVYRVGIVFPIEGNMEIVKKLVAAGFEKERQYKNGSGHVLYEMTFPLSKLQKVEYVRRND